jgi:hypothetical protein
MLSEKIHYPVTLEVHQDGAGMRCAQTKVVYTQYTHVLSTSAQKAFRMRFRRVSGLRSNPIWQANLAPASPPRAKAIHSRASLWRSVARAWTRATSSKRSAKILRSQEGKPQKNFRTRTLRRTGVPHHGRSAKVRM